MWAGLKCLLRGSKDRGGIPFKIARYSERTAVGSRARISHRQGTKRSRKSQCLTKESSKQTHRTLGSLSPTVMKASRTPSTILKLLKCHCSSQVPPTFLTLDIGLMLGRGGVKIKTGGFQPLFAKPGLLITLVIKMRLPKGFTIPRDSEN